ncbi:CHAT domain-containing protein [Streptomyces justiciae]|uniref:CHAT domain-containing protein n=1 Tax=Streptomyces justiciae TaxID=2780140 RepID=UPI00187DF4DB|nr:CHAT domain-containing protein [Streptomyces justiciae]MBE8476792.1 CHAT domain-containing protein [Streptomyces justiciae]
MSREREAERDRLLAAARVRLHRVRATGDAAPLGEPEAQADLGALLGLLAEDPRDVEVGYRVAWLLLCAGPRHLEDSLVEVMADGFARALLAGVDDLPGEFLPGIASAAEPMAVALLRQAHSSPDPQLLDTVVEQHRRLVAATPAGHPARPQRLANLGVALHTRFERRASPEDLTAALAAHREAVATTPAEDPDLSMRLSGLAGVLWSRHRLTGDAADLDGAVDTIRAAADAAPAESPRRAMCLANLALTLRDRFARRGDPADLDSAVEIGRQAWQMTAPDDPNRAIRMHNLAGTLAIRWRVEGATSLEETAARLGAGGDAPLDVYAVAFLAGLDDIPPEVASDVAELAANLVIARQLRLAGAYDAAEWERLVAMWGRILGILPAGDPLRHLWLANLSQAHLLRYQHTGAATDLEAALSTARRSVRAATVTDPDRGMGLVNLAGALAERYRSEGTTEDLDLAVDLMREAVTGLPPDHVLRARYLCDLGGLLGMRFTRHEDPADLDGSVTALRESTRAVPADPMGPGLALSNLGESLLLRHTLAGDPADLDEAVDALWRAVDTTPEEHVGRARYRSSLGAALCARFELRGDGADLDEAVAVLRAAVAGAPPGSLARNGALVNLSVARYFALHRPGLCPADLDEAVNAAREALAALPPGHTGHAKCRALLAHALRVRYEHSANPADLAEAVDLGEGLAVPAADIAPTEAAERLNAGAAAALTDYLRTTSPSDLDAGIASLRAALRTLPPGHASRPVLLANLALALVGRFARSADAADLDAAIDAQRSALAAAGHAHHHRPQLLNGLGSFLVARYVHQEARRDLEEAIDLFAAAAETAPPGHPLRHLVLSAWSDAVRLRAEAEENPADAELSVALARDAVDLAPAHDIRRPLLLCRLGHALLQRHRLGGTGTELDEAVDVLREAAAGPGDLARPLVNSLLGDVLSARFERDGDPADRDEAARLMADGAGDPSLAPMLRIMAALRAGQLAGATDPAGAAALLESTVALLPQVAPRRLRRADRQQALGRFAGLASNVAALALADTTRPDSERALRALRFLETGRGVLMGQALDAWGDLAALRERHPRLADRFEELRELLDRPEESWDALLGGVAGAGPGGSLFEGDRHRLDADFTAVLEEIRAQEGFGSFGLPPTADELLGEAGEGTVVVLNAAPARCDALLVRPSGVTAVPLPGLTLVGVMELAAECQAAAHEAADPDREVRTAAQDTLSDILARLWDLVAEPVLTALGHDRAPADGTYPRVWWVPGGPFGWLPVHAAGRHDGSGRTVLDRVVSSYTPTVRALRHARRPLPDRPAGREPLVVAMPQTPGAPPLDFAEDEVKAFREHFTDPVVLLAPDRPPTRDEVLERLPGCPVAHFACHADSMGEDPAGHLLLLHDHAETPLTVGALAAVRLDHARLAFLSACGTAVSYDGLLADEAIHLTSAFQLSGFRHVVGTLWPVVDDTAVDFAEAFYAALRPAAAEPPDPTLAPYALHAAVRRLRSDFPHTPSLWASHVHTGA